MKLATPRRSITGLAMALALCAGVVGSAAAADHGAQRLNATAYYGSLNVLARQTHDLKAKFTRVDGSPVAGLPVKFTVTGEKAFLCEATTDTDGYAECKNSPLPAPLTLEQLLLKGYDATFDGDDRYAPVSAHNSVGLG
ncbi:Ig-like domain-containing protein [Streptomyces sp. WM6378]|uniref:Ig-like domain-containing protein n=1 Tax=Streptomyces sp. WM6378 TaxID=1415557 RepID=UPI0006ADB875|nr:Ig-like domain-containing protein [Streptomyces sp. WM6378]KOU36261.1 hypothetical protein ADK54_34680 [Streptomyces sp. WM6378]